MLTKTNQDIRDAVTTILQLTQEEKIRQQCEAREDYIRRTTGREELLKQATQERDQAQAERDRAFTERDQAYVERDQACAERNLLHVENSKLNAALQRLREELDHLKNKDRVN